MDSNCNTAITDPLDQVDDATIRQIAANAVAMARVLGKRQSQHRGALVAGLFNHVETSDVRVLTGMRDDTIRKHKRDFKDDKLFEAPLFTARAALVGAGGRKRGTDRQEDARCFLERKTRVTQSGDQADTFRTFASKWNTFDSYREQGGKLDSACLLLLGKSLVSRRRRMTSSIFSRA